MIQLRLILAFLIAFGPMLGQAQTTDLVRSEYAFTNLLGPYNNGFESGKAKWTASGGTFAISTSSPFKGKQYATWDSSSAAQTLTSTAFTMPRNGNCEISSWVAVPSGTATTLFEAYDGTNVLASMTILNFTDFREQTIVFPCPTSGTVLARFKSVASNEPSISIDDVGAGKARGIGTTNINSDWGGTAWTPTGNPTTNATYTGLWKQIGDEYEYRVRIAFSGASTFTGLTINLPSGHVINTAKLTSSTQYAPIDGKVGVLSDTGVGLYNATVAYESTTAVRVLSILTNSTNGISQDVSGTGPFTVGSGDFYEVSFRLPIVGANSISIWNSGAQGLSWSGYHASDCSWTRTNTAFGDPSADASCTFTERQNRNFGSVTSYLSGSDKLPGIVFTPKVSGRYFICATAASYGPATQFAGIRHALSDGTTQISAVERQMSSTAQELAPMTTCGIYNATVASTTIRLQTSSSSGSIVMTGVGATTASIEWSIFNLDQPVSAILMNDVITSNLNGDRITHAQTAAQCTASPCTISKSSGNVTSITRTGTGDYTVNYTGYSDVPTCVAGTGPGAAVASVHIASVTSTAVRINLFQSALGSAIDQNAFYVICTGAR